VTEHTTKIASPHVRDLATRYAEPAWLQTAREVAWDHYTNMPVPQLEKTNISKRSWEVGPYATAPADTVLADVTAILEDTTESFATVYIRDGFLVETRGLDTFVAQGVIVSDLRTALKDHESLVKQHLGTVVKSDESKWAALNAAVWHNGLFVYVPKNIVIDKPIQFVIEESGASASAIIRSLVVAEEMSNVKVTEVFVTTPERTAGYVDVHILEVVAKTSAQVTFASVNQLVKGPTHFVVKRASVAKDACVDWIFGDVGDGFSVVLVESLPNGIGSKSSIDALSIGSGRQHLDLTTSMVHAGRFSESNIVMHGVLKGRANSVYRSSTHILVGAADAASEQSDRVIILDSSARADAIPMLLIDEHQVKRCGHAARVGRIDENQIYYLMSRGIPQPVATQLIVWGYLQPTADAIPSDAVRSHLVKMIERKLAE